MTRAESFSQVRAAAMRKEKASLAMAKRIMTPEKGSELAIVEEAFVLHESVSSRLNRKRLLSIRSQRRESGGRVGGSVVTWFPNRIFVATQMKRFSHTPNQALEPTALSVTIRAYARLAPARAVAHL